MFIVLLINMFVVCVCECCVALLVCYVLCGFRFCQCCDFVNVVCKHVCFVYVCVNVCLFCGLVCVVLCCSFRVV